MSENDVHTKQGGQPKTRVVLYLLAVIGFTVIYAAYLVSLDSIGRHSVGTKEPVVSPQPSLVSDERSTLDRIATYVHDRDVDSCLTILNQELRDLCVTNVNYEKALYESDITICESMKTSIKSVDECVREVLISLATEYDETSVCMQTPRVPIQEDCLTVVYMNRALETNDQSFCQNIPQEWSRSNCVEILSNSQ